MAIINAYAPTMMKAKSQPELTEAFYQDLEKAYKREKRGAMFTLMLGDFNAKVGAGEEHDARRMGKCGKGRRNDNCGEALLSFIRENRRIDYALPTHVC